MFRYIIILLSILAGVQSVVAQNHKMVDVLIVGGGISGLSAAYELKKAGLSFRVLELKPRLGGRIQTVRFPEYHVEAGLAEFWSENPAVKLIKEFNLKTEASVAFSSVLIDGTVHPYVQETNEEYLQALLGEEEYNAFTRWNKEMARYHRALETRPLSKDLLALKDISFKEWLIKNAQLAHKTLEFIRLTVEVETGSSWSNISALDGIDEWGLFLGDGQIPHALIDGNEALINALHTFVGVDAVLVNRQVKSIAQHTNHVEITALDTATYESHTYKGQYVISTVPLYRLLFDINFTPPLSATVQQAIQTQTWGAYCTVLVFMKAEAQKFWTFDGESALPILTDTALGVLYDGNPTATDDQQKVLSLLTTGHYAERFNLQPQDQTEAEIRRQFELLWPGSAAVIERIELFRQHPRAIAAWPVGRSRFDALSEAVRTPHGRLYLAGDFTENSHSSGAVTSGFRAARAIADRVLVEERRK